MTKMAVSVGQNVALLRIMNAARYYNDRAKREGRKVELDELLLDGVVKSVGRKYFEVEFDYQGKVDLFDLETGYQKTNYSADFKVYLSRQAVLEEFERDRVIQEIRVKLEWKNGFSFDQVTRIMAICQEVQP